MSRNLCQRYCYFCDAVVVKVGPDRFITAADVSVYFDEYDGMIVADAECPDCEAKYLAWVNGERRRQYRYPDPQPGEDRTLIRDLSFRSTFNDEPGAADMPKYVIRELRERVPLDRLYEPETARSGNSSEKRVSGEVVNVRLIGAEIVKVWTDAHRGLK